MTSSLTEKDTLNIRNILNADGIIAFPTDTVWGIGCLPENAEAVEKIYSIKSRDRGKPLILLGKNLQSLLPFVDKIPEKALELAKKHFPGAITIVVKKSSLAKDYMTAGFDTIGIRIPDCPVFIEMLEKCTKNGVLATTSANISDAGSVSTIEEVLLQLGEKIDYIINDDGFCPKGTESTVVFIGTGGEIKILRQGAVIL